MGQSASRARRSSPAAAESTASTSSPSSSTVPTTETTTSTPAAPARRGHKWRRSLMGLVTPNHAYSERKSSRLRKKDRDSPPASSSSPSDKEEEPSHERPATPFPSMMSPLAAESRIDEDEDGEVAEDDDGEWAAEPTVGDTVADDEPDEGSSRVDDDELLRQLLNPLPPPSPPPPETPPPPLPPQPRQFPPPGTLVVVQGVVHTTDIPRTTTSTTPAATTTTTTTDAHTDTSTPRPRALSTPRSSTRNRLSALLRSRPASMNVNAPSPEEHEPTSPTHAHASGSTISSSSIDVLGTLLSVAAAATAASLLTGSSEPVLSPSPSSPSALQDPWLSRPPPSIGPNDSSNRAERMRQAWGSIRERLGLRSPPSPGLNTPPDTPGSVSPSSPPIAPTTFGGLHVPRTPVDPREVMLAEMARAFNIGFGIPGASGSVSDPESRPTSTPGSEGAGTRDPPGENNPAEGVEELPLPEEGSFERFLIDLQADLRVALTQGDEENPEDEEDTQREQSNHAWTRPNNQTTDDTDSIPALASVSDSSDEDTSDEEYHTDAESHARSLEDPMGSAFAFNAPRTNSSNAPTSFPEPPPRSSTIPNTDRPPIQPTGQINWWRLYRFPAIIDPQVPPTVRASAGQASNPIIPTPTNPSPFSVPLTASPADHPALPGYTASTSPSIPSSTTPPILTDPATPSTVIPVIVVGLQSVQLNWRRDANGTPIPPTEVEADTTPEGDPDLDALDSDMDAGSTNARGRGWQTRAAEAIRSLRPGTLPRGAAADTPDGEGEERQGATGMPGSRTFLIYVIGGYYPPDHSIVTGGPNNLDSFEALLELAELLGQVKPPTASKEEIEKSGLEVIHADMLREYEQSGKISENCIERCLICLDEYVPEEEVRVLKCRHAFHMGCVDKWLQTGKNNCPACRSRGVPTEPYIPRAGDL